MVANIISEQWKILQGCTETILSGNRNETLSQIF